MLDLARVPPSAVPVLLFVAAVNDFARSAVRYFARAARFAEQFVAVGVFVAVVAGVAVEVVELVVVAVTYFYHHI